MHNQCRLAIAIRLYIASSNTDQKSLAQEWECSESTVTRFLSGQAMPESRTMARMFLWCLENDSSGRK